AAGSLSTSLVFQGGGFFIKNTTPAIVKSDAHGTESDFRLFVKRDRSRRIEGDAVPYQLSTTLIETEVRRKAPCEVCALHFEATRAREVFVERDVMQQGSYRDDFRVVFNVLELPNPHCKEPGADNVVEKVRLALQSGILHGPVDRWRRGNLYPGEYSSIDRLHVLLPFSIAFRVLRRSPIRCERTRRSPPAVLETERLASPR